MTPFALAAIASLLATQPAPSAAPDSAVPKRLLTLGDNVKVRAAPAADGALNGYLFKNMVVEVLERSPKPEVVGGVTGYWYRVSRGALSGWSFGSFFTAQLPEHPIDTYDLPDLDGWWGNRFGWSTEYQENGITDAALEKLEMDDYRGLFMMAASQRHEQSGVAWSALLGRLYPFLKKHGDDPKWHYLRDKAWDPAFLGEMIARHGGAGMDEVLPARLLKDAAFKAALCKRAGARPPLCAPPAAAPR
jgi:hypothetical protein